MRDFIFHRMRAQIILLHDQSIPVIPQNKVPLNVYSVKEMSSRDGIAIFYIPQNERPRAQSISRNESSDNSTT